MSTEHRHGGHPRAQDRGPRDHGGDDDAILILALRSDWRAAQRVGRYEVSTLGQTLAEVGYLHASRPAQLPGVAERHYRGVREALVLLVVDPTRLDVPVVVEGGFPHLYGPLPVGAVSVVLPVSSADTDDEVPLLPALPRPEPPQPPDPFIG